MYTLSVHNVVWGENSTKYYPICRVVHVFGVQKGEIPYGLATFCHFPHFIHFIVIIPINIEKPNLPVRCTSIPVIYGMWSGDYRNSEKVSQHPSQVSWHKMINNINQNWLHFIPRDWVSWASRSLLATRAVPLAILYRRTLKNPYHEPLLLIRIGITIPIIIFWLFSYDHKMNINNRKKIRTTTNELP